MISDWQLSSSSDRAALDVVDGTGKHHGKGPHYSRRTPGSKTFTGVGREIVLITSDHNAVWSVVLQKTPARKGSGKSRGRNNDVDCSVGWVWRNNVFRNLGPSLSSDLIKQATDLTYELWMGRYGELPACRLRTEIDLSHIKSTNPGYCYLCAGWSRGEKKRGKLFLYASEDMNQLLGGGDE